MGKLTSSRATPAGQPRRPPPPRASLTSSSSLTFCSVAVPCWYVLMHTYPCNPSPLPSMHPGPPNPKQLSSPPLLHLTLATQSDLWSSTSRSFAP